MSDETRATIERFHDAFNAHDLDALAGLITADCLFEDTDPPDGTRYTGREAVLAAWQQFFTDSPQAQFELEDMITTGDRAVVRWLYRWADGHVRGIDLMRVRDGQVAESIGYVKG